MPTPFEVIVARHGPTVLRVCRAVLGPVEADDAWSETFLAALRAYPDLRPDSNVEAWLVTIAHRKALDQVRAAARRPVPTDEVPERPMREGAVHDAQVHDGAVVNGDPATDLGADLFEALAALPLRQRQCVAYHHVAGLPYAEVAEIVGGTAAAARRAAADGIANLRKTFPQGGTR